MKKISIGLILLLLASMLYPQEKSDPPVKDKSGQKEKPSDAKKKVSPENEKSSLPAKSPPLQEVKAVRKSNENEKLPPAKEQFEPWSLSLSFSLYQPNLQALNDFFTAEELRLQLPVPSIFESRYGAIGTVSYSLSPVHELGCLIYFSGAAQMRSQDHGMKRRNILLLAGPSYQFNWIDPFNAGVDLQFRIASGYSYASFSRSYADRGTIVFRQSNAFAAGNMDAYFPLSKEFGITLGAGYLFLPKRAIGSSDQACSLSSPLLTAGVKKGF